MNEKNQKANVIELSTEVVEFKRVFPRQPSLEQLTPKVEDIISKRMSANNEMFQTVLLTMTEGLRKYEEEVSEYERYKNHNFTKNEISSIQEDAQLSLATIRSQVEALYPKQKLLGFLKRVFLPNPSPHKLLELSSKTTLALPNLTYPTRLHSVQELVMLLFRYESQKQEVDKIKNMIPISDSHQLNKQLQNHSNYLDAAINETRMLIDKKRPSSEVVNIKVISDLCEEILANIGLDDLERVRELSISQSKSPHYAVDRNKDKMRNNGFEHAWMPIEHLQQLLGFIADIQKIEHNYEQSEHFTQTEKSLLLSSLRDLRSKLVTVIQNVKFTNESEKYRIEESEDILYHQAPTQILARMLVSGQIRSRTAQEEIDGTSYFNTGVGGVKKSSQEKAQLYFNSRHDEKSFPHAHAAGVYGSVSGDNVTSQSSFIFPKRILLEERQFFINDGLALYDNKFSSNDSRGLVIDIEESGGLLLLDTSWADTFRDAVIAECKLVGADISLVRERLNRIVIFASKEQVGEPGFTEFLWKEMGKRYPELLSKSFPPQRLVPTGNVGDNLVGENETLYGFEVV